jgi:hypothetical protein
VSTERSLNATEIAIEQATLKAMTYQGSLLLFIDIDGFKTTLYAEIKLYYMQK